MRENQEDGLPDIYPEGVTYVWVIDEGVRARVIELGAHYAKVSYVLNGIAYEVVLLNDEYLMMEDTYEVPTWECGFDGNDK